MISVRHVLFLSLVIAGCTSSGSSTSAPPVASGSAAPSGAEPAPPAPPAGGTHCRTAPGSLPMPAPSPAGKPGTITVTAAVYGGNCDCADPQATLVTSYVAAACNGKASCDYKVEYGRIGDPAMGCSKGFVAKWHCGDDTAAREQTAPGEAGYGAVIALTCAK